jgi:hypothetical protein
VLSPGGDFLQKYEMHFVRFKVCFLKNHYIVILIFVVYVFQMQSDALIMSIVIIINIILCT